MEGYPAFSGPAERVDRKIGVTGGGRDCFFAPGARVFAPLLLRLGMGVGTRDYRISVGDEEP